MVSIRNLFSVLFATSSPSNHNNNLKEISGVAQLIEAVGTYRSELRNPRIKKTYTPEISFAYEEPTSQPLNAEELNEDDDLFFVKVAESHDHTKPLVLYLPGLDGGGIGGALQFRDLAETFEFWRMTISTDDRSTFAELIETVTEFVNDAAVSLDRPMILIGESFGGMLAPAVVLRHNNKKKKQKNPIEGLVLVNPALPYEQTTFWPSFGPFVTALDNKNNNGPLPSLYLLLGSLGLAATIPDDDQYQKIVSVMLQTRIQSLQDVTDLVQTLEDGLQNLNSALPSGTMAHRLKQWLLVGSAVVNPRIKDIDIQTLVVVGNQDKMIPSKQEADRLVELLPHCEKVELRDAGHFVLDSRANLTDIMLESSLFYKITDPITDWRLPSDYRIKLLDKENVGNQRKLFSPVFFSTSATTGQRYLGLGQLPGPDDGPLLFVGNHQLFGFDLGMIISQLIYDRGIVARGLAHPFVFNTGDGNSQSPKSLFERMGAVMVSPRNYYRLMQTGQSALLFPGGVREVFHGKNEAYKLFWPEKVDFVRIAAKFNATVIPLSAVGAADSIRVLVDAPDVLKLPFLGPRAANWTKNVTAARFDTDANAELFVPPIPAPKDISRFYFLFGEPMSTTDMDFNDKEACEEFYKEVKSRVEIGLDDLVRAKEHDPFKDPVRRIPYEQITGKKAPTFPMDIFSSTTKSSS